MGHARRRPGEGHPQHPVVQEGVGVAHLRGEVTQSVIKWDTLVSVTEVTTPESQARVQSIKVLNLDSDVFALQPTVDA